MKLANTPSDFPFPNTIDLTSNIEKSPYHLALCTIPASPEKKGFQVISPTISLLLIDGKLSLINTAGEVIEIRPHEGLHLFEGSSFRLKGEAGSRFLVASSEKHCLRNVLALGDKLESIPLSSYRVTKPWGWERWYTQNNLAAPYALKLICMEKGARSSLQSHNLKRESTLVISGKASVLSGILAPENPNEVIDSSKLTEESFTPFEGWSNQVRELHRVIARETYLTVEISTIELDDVIRWQDDQNRPHGRIDSEHTQSL